MDGWMLAETLFHLFELVCVAAGLVVQLLHVCHQGSLLHSTFSRRRVGVFSKYRARRKKRYSSKLTIKQKDHILYIHGMLRGVLTFFCWNLARDIETYPVIVPHYHT